jgi:hypothetical protein
LGEWGSSEEALDVSLARFLVLALSRRPRRLLAR